MARSRSPGSRIPVSRRAGGGPPPELPLLEVRLDHRREPHGLSEIILREGAEAHLIACRLSDHTPRRLVRWLDLEVDPERSERLLHAVRRRLGPGHLAEARLGPGRWLLRVSEPAPDICLATFRAGGICATCPLLAHRERDGWRVVLPRGASTQEFLKELSTPGSSGHLAIARLKPYRSGTTLTLRQHRALRVAYDLGYFDYPRRGTLADVARALGAGRSATLEMLRRATAKLAGSRRGGELRARPSP